MADRTDAATVLCHCSDCRKRSGSPFGAMAYFPRDAVSVEGEAREFTRPSDNGFTFTTGFCPDCGSTVYGLASRMPQIMGLTLGTLEEGAQLAPTRSVYEQGRFDWVQVPGGIPRHQQGRGS
ncbi:hypothetical protein GCM10009127_17210 [Alteraurantiacibacter aestuarii]